MVYVSGSDAYTGFAIAEQTAFATANTTDGDFIQLPLIGETTKLEREEIARPAEMGGSGSRSYHDFGRSIVRGTIKFKLRYNMDGFLIMLGHLFGDEVLCPDVWVNGVANGTNLANTHAFTTKTTIPLGLTARIFKSGPTAGGHYDQVVGMILNTMVLEKPEDDAPEVEFGFIAKSMTPLTASGKSLPAVIGTQVVKSRCLSLTGSGVESRFKIGLANSSANLTSLNMRSFSLRVDMKRDPTTAFTNNPDAMDSPGKTGDNDITLSIGSLMEQILPTAGNDIYHPLYQYDNKIEGSVEIRMVSEVNTAGGKPYAIRCHLPRVAWTAVDDPISGQGELPWTAEAVALAGTVASEATTDLAASTVLAQVGGGDLRMFVCVNKSDEPSPGDTTFSTELPSSVP